MLARGRGDVGFDLGVIIGRCLGCAGGGEGPILGGVPINVAVLPVHVPLLVLPTYLYELEGVRGTRTRALTLLKTQALTENRPILWIQVEV